MCKSQQMLNTSGDIIQSKRSTIGTPIGHKVDFDFRG